MDIQQARLDPKSQFQQPQQVVEHPDLSTDDKIAILQRWEYDTREVMVADEENMAAETPVAAQDDTGELLRNIRKALQQLGAGGNAGDGDHQGSPNKQG